MSVIGTDEAYEVEKLRFYAFQHPFICRFIQALADRDRFKSLLSLANQSLSTDTIGIIPPNLFQATYNPFSIVDEKEYPRFDVDFRRGGAYSQYNWELFFHIPLLISARLSQDQRHEEAMRWLDYIFNPTTDSKDPIPQRYWFFKPLRDIGKPPMIKEMLQKLQTPAANADFEAAIDDWRDHPFEPHRIARGRPGAYQKAVVMKYLDLLLAEGDKLFRRDTIESINQAIQYYVLVAKSLGRRPIRAPELVTPASSTYADLRPTLDKFSSALAQIESIAPPFTTKSAKPSPGAESALGLGTLYFCIPPNDDLLRYWDTVEDRLFKIRHCMNIEGIVRELPLFEPPIDPALLVRATAMGLDLSQVLDDLAAPLPHYRFTFMLQRAREFCEELKQIGSLLLSTLEKKDAEELSQVRARHEKDLFKAVLEVKKRQVKEAEETKESLEKAREMAETRSTHYTAISKQLPQEKQFLDKQAQAVVSQMASQMAALAGSTMAALPDVTYVSRMGYASAVGSDWKTGGGSGAAAVANLVSMYLGWLSQIASLEGTTASYKGGLIRAKEDRDLQIKIATHETDQIDKQIAAAEIRLKIAEKELANHETQIEQAEKMEDFFRDKFTNKDLYSWMKEQVSAVYFQAYKLAYDLAKRAERVYRHELGITDSKVIQFGAWDNLRKGLLAGEKLSLDLRRLEHVYLEKNKREYEITKHISLRQLDPIALLTLKATGKCEVEVPEWLFDLDTPGHYMRRIKSVGLSIPSVAGPYTSVNCTLSLLKSTVRKSAEAGTTYAKQNEDKRFVDYIGPVQSVVTSGPNNDSGMFETNLRDERFLPFEGAGAVSTWRLELPNPKEYPSFDYATISDVIMHFRYTSRQGVPIESVKTYLHDLLPPKSDPEARLAMLFSLRHDFSSEWSRFVNGNDDFTTTIRRDYMPYFTQGRKIGISGFELYSTTHPQMISRSVTETTAATATNDLTDPTKRAFTFVASEDKDTTDPTKPLVLVRHSDANVFLIIHYSLSKTV